MILKLIDIFRFHVYRFSRDSVILVHTSPVTYKHPGPIKMWYLVIRLIFHICTLSLYSNIPHILCYTNY